MFRDISPRLECGSTGRATVEDVYGDIVIVPHHPDRLRRPSPGAGAHDEEHFIHALTWNVFRTLELLPPAFWLRRLHACLSGDAPGAAAQTVDVTLWRELLLPPARRIDGARPAIVADVVIETEYAVWAFLTATAWDTRWFEGDPGQADISARMIAAASWLAGTRDCHIGLIQSIRGDAASERAAVQRYSRSSDSLRLRAGSGPGSLRNVRGAGLLRWSQLATVLQDCAQAAVLTDIERALALNAVSWLAEVGVVAAADRERS
jgi:hypothetical protein